MLFLLNLITGFSQGITLVLLIPLLGLIQPVNELDGNNKWVDFLNDFFVKSNIEINIELILTVFAICLILVTILNYFKTIIQSTYQQEFSYSIRRNLFKKIISSDWLFLNGKSKHNHIQILTTEVPKMGIYYYYYLDLANKSIFIITHILLAMMISVNFTLIVVATGIIVFVLLGKYIKKADLLGTAGIKTFRNMLKRIDDFWLTVKIAKVHHSENFYFQKFEETNNQMLDIQNMQIKNRAIPQLLFSIAGLISLVLFVYISYSIISIPLTSIFVLILLFSRIFPQLSSINNDLNMMVSGAGSVKMVLDIDKELSDQYFSEENQSEVNNDSKTEKDIPLFKELELRNLTFSYDPDNQIFNNFSAKIPLYKITGITGKSGIGKTTLIDLIAGLLKTNEGGLYIDGVKLSDESFPLWKKKLGYLPQDSFFIDGTIRENLVWDTERVVNDNDIMHALKLVNAEDLILKLNKGIDTYITNYPYHFSGGERQRLALARVILRKPDLLLLDEATSSLDPENELSIMNYLNEIKKNITVIFITHKTELIKYFDNHINLDKL
jgi:ATP-binding cassette subfamily C protein